MAASWGTKLPYGSYREALSSIYYRDYESSGGGGIRGLWRGVRPTLLGSAPYAGISFGIFETLKKNYIEVQNPSADHLVLSGGTGSVPTVTVSDPSSKTTSLSRLAAGAVAGLTAQTLTYPLDIVRRRMQIQGLAGPSKSPEFRNEFHALHLIWKNEGVRRGLFKGLSMNYIKGPVAMAISFNLNDFLKGEFMAGKPG